MREGSKTDKYIMFPSGSLHFFLPIEKIEKIVPASSQMEELEVIDFNAVLWGESKSAEADTAVDTESDTEADTPGMVPGHMIILKDGNRRYGLRVEPVAAIRTVKEEERIPFQTPARNERNHYLEYVVYQPKEQPSLIYIIDADTLYRTVWGESNAT